ncbi:MAG: 1-acyl-sn-glycerol-3-phosphate acyltransferase [Pseudomonadota bacterium]
MLRRRLLSVPAVFLGAAFLVLIWPVLLIIALLASIAPRYRGAWRTLGFLSALAALEVAGVTRLFWNWIRHRDPTMLMQRDYHVQFWWAGALMHAGAWLFRLSFEVRGADAIAGPSAILIPRHVSIGDNVLPLLHFAKPRGQTIRYLLKKELTWLPTLDIGGHRLPNLFVDRSGANTAQELQAVRALATGAGPEESLLIYTDGTRLTRANQAELAAKPHLKEQVERWPDLLPPRLGGVSEMLAVNQDKDVVFMAHAGFDGGGSLGSLLRGSWTGQHIIIEFWRVPFAELPDDHRAFIFAQWDRMQATVASLADEVGLNRDQP